MPPVQRSGSRHTTPAARADMPKRQRPKLRPLEDRPLWNESFAVVLSPVKPRVASNGRSPEGAPEESTVCGANPLFE